MRCRSWITWMDHFEHLSNSKQKGLENQGLMCIVVETRRIELLTFALRTRRDVFYGALLDTTILINQ